MKNPYAKQFATLSALCRCARVGKTTKVYTQSRSITITFAEYICKGIWKSLCELYVLFTYAVCSKGSNFEETKLIDTESLKIYSILETL